MTDKVSIKNGQIWQAPWPYCHQAFILWVGLKGQADSYMLVSTPSIMGPSPAMPMGDPDAPGKLIQTQAEIEARLKKYDWKLLDRHYLTVIDRNDPWFESSEAGWTTAPKLSEVVDGSD